MTGVTATPILPNTNTKNGKSNSSNLAADFTTLLKQNSPLKSGLQGITKLFVSNFAIFGDTQAFSFESGWQSYTGEVWAPLKCAVLNFSYTAGDSNTGEVFAP